MTLLARMRRKRSSASTLAVLLLSSMGLLGTPCTMAFALDTPSTQSTDLAKKPGAHDDCPNSKPANSMTPSDCCCDLTDAALVKTPETLEFFAVLSVPIEVRFPALIVADSGTINTRTLHFGASPPIYLATQRLRI